MSKSGGLTEELTETLFEKIEAKEIDGFILMTYKGIIDDKREAKIGFSCRASSNAELWIHHALLAHTLNTRFPKSNREKALKIILKTVENEIKRAIKEDRLESVLF